MIRGILFDCFGVLYQGSLTHLAELAAPADRQAVRDLAHASDHGFISRADYFTQLGALVHLPPEEVETIVERLHVRNEPLIAFVRQLHHSYKVGLLSNVGQDMMTRLFRPEELEELFDCVVLSSDVGLIKPDPLIYDYAANKLGVEPEACVMIDDLPVNIDGAERAGMQGIVFASLSQLQHELRHLLVEV